MAARIRSGSFVSEAWKALAVPWNDAWMSSGMWISCRVRSIAAAASPSDEPGGKLKEMVTHGNWPWWLTDERRRSAFQNG